MWSEANAKAATAQITLANAQIEEAQASLNAANLQLSYTTVGPESQFVTSKSVQTGDYVQVRPGSTRGELFRG